jgi:hypothetical protein
LCPETDEHKRIKELVLAKLRGMYGTGLSEYPDSGQVNDVYVITPNQIEIFVENVWTSTKSNFQRDLNILHRSKADVKILIVNPKILEDKSLLREFEKTKMSEIRRGVAISDMIDGSPILSPPETANNKFVEIVQGLVKEALTRKELSQKNPISVSPETISWTTGSWATRSLFKVYNRTDEVYFQIWIKLAIEEPNIPSQSIRIDTPKPKDELVIESKTFKISGDIVRFNGVQKGYNVIFLLLASLNPKETLPFILSGTGSASATLQFPTKIFIKISDFSKEPSEMISRLTNHGEEAAIGFKPPENFKLQGVGFRIARTRST